jgi:hypothetical protein
MTPPEPTSPDTKCPFCQAQVAANTTQCTSCKAYISPEKTGLTIQHAPDPKGEQPSSTPNYVQKGAPIAMSYNANIVTANRSKKLNEIKKRKRKEEEADKARVSDTHKGEEMKQMIAPNPKPNHTDPDDEGIAKSCLDLAIDG